MTIKVIKYIGHFILLVFLQAFVFNNILLFGLLHPFIYLYFTLFLPLSLNRNVLLIIAFLTGLILDMFSNTYGIHISAMLFVAFFRNIVLQLSNIGDELNMDMEPHINTLGIRRFSIFIFSMVFIHHLVLFFLHEFSFQYFIFTFYKVVLNTLFSSLLIFVYELLLFYNVKETR